MALAMGCALQLALAFAPDPGIGPAAGGLSDLHPSTSAVLDVFAHNLLTAALIAVGGLAAGWTVLSRETPHPRRRLLAYLGLLGAAYWAYFVSGVNWMAADMELSRPALTARLVHGYLEWPALLLPWAAIAFAITARRKLDLRLVAAACICSVALLGASALVEALVVPGLLGA